MDRRRSGKLGSMYLAVRAIIHCNSFSVTRRSFISWTRTVQKVCTTV
jgi:hypothetical protein